MPNEKESLAEVTREWLSVKRQIDDLSVIARELEARVCLLMDSKQKTIEGIGTLERMPATTRKSWDHPRLAHLVARKALDTRVPDEDTGEVPDSTTTVVGALLAAAGISYWKVGETKKLGINADDYCEKEYGNPRIRVITS